MVETYGEAGFFFLFQADTGVGHQTTKFRQQPKAFQQMKRGNVK
jgi:hypothetical protein